jgi:hypothetical protein
MPDSFLMLQAPHRCCLSIAALLLATGCPPGDAGTPKAQAPKIIVQTPQDAPRGVTTGATAVPGASRAPYAGANWQNQGLQTDEPFEVQSLLREFDPQLVDVPNDQRGDLGYTDLISAFAVLDARYLYARVVPRQPMKRDKTAELRFWLEQGSVMTTVEVKIGTRERPCELSDVENPEKQTIVPACFWLGNAIDIRIPRDSVPSNIDMSKPFHVSGFQTCCEDEARTIAFDSIEEAQEVWRVPGLADELQAADQQEFVPGNEEADGAPNVP